MLALEAPAEVSVAALSTVEQPITLRAPRDAVRGRQQLILVVDKLDGGSGEARQPSAFFAPPWTHPTPYLRPYAAPAGSSFW